jgi:hypothetical protein
MYFLRIYIVVVVDLFKLLSLVTFISTFVHLFYFKKIKIYHIFCYEIIVAVDLFKLLSLFIF